MENSSPDNQKPTENTGPFNPGHHRDHPGDHGAEHHKDHLDLHPDDRPHLDKTLPVAPELPTFPPPPAPAEPLASPSLPPAPAAMAFSSSPVAEQPVYRAGVMPMPVVRVLSPRGVEYVFMTISLVIGAIGLVIALLSLVNGKTSFSALSFPVAMLAVTVPVFSWLFLRLKHSELVNPSLALDPSKRRSTQFIQIVTFLTCIFTLIGFIAALFAKMGGEFDGSLWKLILDVVVIVGVAGGILFYYWKDEHRA